MAKNQNKTTENEQSVDDFLDNVKDEKKRADSFQIKEMIQRVTDTKPKMWGNSIIGYGNYHYKYASGREGDFLKVGFSPRAQNLTIYIMPGFDRYDDLMEQLGKFKTGKSCLYIKKLEDIDQEVLAKLVEESFAYMTKKYG